MADPSKATFGFANSDEVRLTYTLTLTAKEWREVVDAMPPASGLSAAGHVSGSIAQMVNTAVGHTAKVWQADPWRTTEVTPPAPTGRDGDREDG